MKRMIWIVAAMLALSACGGNMGTGGSPKPPGALVDPSGNWTMTASDSLNNDVLFAALFNQVGPTVTANSFTAAGNPAPFACVPFTAILSQGTVSDVDHFTGQVTIRNSSSGADFGTFSFTTTLAADGLSFSGTYSGMPNCTGALPTGNFVGKQVPSVTGTWTGTAQPCEWDFSTGQCGNLFGEAVTVSMTLFQDDATGIVTGSYTTTGTADFSSGTVAVTPPFDILSGPYLQFTMSDASGLKFVVGGRLADDKSFDGQIHTVTGYYKLTMSHP